MKPLLPFLILLSLTFSINSLATETNLTHKPLELSYSYKLLIEIDNASEQTKLLHKFFNSTDGILVYSTFEEKNGSVKMTAYDGRKSFYTKKLTFDLNTPDNINIFEQTETPLLYKYEASFRKIECEWINIMVGNERFGQLQTIDFSNQDGNQTKTPLNYKIKIIFSKYINLTSSQMELQLALTDRLPEYTSNYLNLFVVTLLFNACGFYVLLKHFTLMLKNNNTFLFYCMHKNLMDSFEDLALAAELGFSPVQHITNLYIALFIIGLLSVLVVHCWLTTCCCRDQCECENVLQQIKKQFFWPIHFIIFFLYLSEAYPVIFIFTAFNLYINVKRVNNNKKEENIIVTFIVLLSMAYFGWIRMCEDYSIRNFQGFFNDENLISYPPMSWTKVILLEFNMLLMMPVLREFLSKCVICCYKGVSTLLKGNNEIHRQNQEEQTVLRDVSI